MFLGYTFLSLWPCSGFMCDNPIMRRWPNFHICIFAYSLDMEIKPWHTATLIRRLCLHIQGFCCLKKTCSSLDMEIKTLQWAAARSGSMGGSTRSLWLSCFSLISTSVSSPQAIHAFLTTNVPQLFKYVYFCTLCFVCSGSARSLVFFLMSCFTLIGSCSAKPFGKICKNCS